MDTYLSKEFNVHVVHISNSTDLHNTIKQIQKEEMPQSAPLFDQQRWTMTHQ